MTNSRNHELNSEKGTDAISTRINYRQQIVCVFLWTAYAVKHTYLINLYATGSTLIKLCYFDVKHSCTMLSVLAPQLVAI